MKKLNRSSMTDKALKALREAVAQAIEEHRRLGIPLAVWRDGRAISIPPEAAATLHEAHGAYRTEPHGPNH